MRSQNNPEGPFHISERLLGDVMSGRKVPHLMCQPRSEASPIPWRRPLAKHQNDPPPPTPLTHTHAPGNVPRPPSPFTFHSVKFVSCLWFLYFVYFIVNVEIPYRISDTFYQEKPAAMELRHLAHPIWAISVLA